MFARARRIFKATENVFKYISMHDFNKQRVARVKGFSSPIFRTGGVLCAAAVITSPGDDHEENSKLKSVDPQTLTSSYLIRNAAKANVDSAMTLLTQTATTLLEIHEQYVTMLDQLLKLHEMTVEAHGQPHMEERVSDAVLVTRKKLADIKAAKQEIEILYSSVERLVTNSAEVAFFSGADHACTIANERLFAAQEKLNMAVQTSHKAEMSLREHEAWVVAETMKREEELKAAASSAKSHASPAELQDSGLPSESETRASLSRTESTGGAETSGGDAGINETISASTQYNSSEQDDGWFSVVFGDEGSDSNRKNDFSQPDDAAFGEQEDERKWANAK